MPKKKQIGSCSVCGKELYDGDRAYATTTGSMCEELGGFGASDTDPWLTVACEDCGSKISNIISYVVGYPEKIDRIIGAVKKVCQER